MMRALPGAVALLLGCSFASTAWSSTVSVTVLDAAGKPLRDAVAFLESAQAKRAVKPLASAAMTQKDKSFVPAVLVVTTGTSVAFPNLDTVRHHVYSFSPAKRFELKLYVGTPANPVLFDQPGVVVMGCNIHDQMVAQILVVDTPYHGITNADGVIALNDVPPGDYTLRTWHSRLPVGTAAPSQALKAGAANSAVEVVLK